MKKIIVVMIMATAGLGLMIFGFLSLKSVEKQNAVIAAINNESLKSPKTDESLKLDQKIPANQFILSLVYLWTGDFEQGGKILTQIIVNPGTPDFWRVRAFYNLANLQFIKGLQTQDKSALKNAIFYYQEALRLEPNFWLAKYNLEKLIKKDVHAKQQQQEEEQKDNDKQKKEENKTNEAPDMNPPSIGLP